MQEKITRPDVGNTVVLSGAVVVGDVSFGPDCSVWYNAVLRGDAAPIRLGRGCNVQDNATVHCSKGLPAVLGDYVTVGHNAVIHGCTIGSHTLIGMGAIVLNGAVIGEHCLVGAGALVTGKSVIPAGSLVLGNPATVRRPLNQKELDEIERVARIYMENKERYR